MAEIFAAVDRVESKYGPVEEVNEYKKPEMITLAYMLASIWVLVETAIDLM